MPTPPLTPPNNQNPSPGKTPPPLRPRVPNLAPDPHQSPAMPPVAASAPVAPAVAGAPATPAAPSGPRRKCPNCRYFPMKLLAEFKDDDIEQTLVGDTYVPSGPFSLMAPFLSLFIIITSAVGNVLFAKAKDAKSRSKVRHARADILARCPNSLICPECCEVLELY